MAEAELSQKLSHSGLRVTPQRVAIFSALNEMKNHPTAENVITYIAKKHPNIAVGTVYNVLDSLVDKGLVKKVKTDNGVMRFDACTERHHHLYCQKTQRIEDYKDVELDRLIADHFKKKGITDFEIEDFKIEITGNFK